jgi:hypothetical protein
VGFFLCVFMRASMQSARLSWRRMVQRDRFRLHCLPDAGACSAVNVGFELFIRAAQFPPTPAPSRLADPAIHAPSKAAV